MEPPKDPTTYGWLTYAWVLGLSFAGGAVSFLRKVREGQSRVYNLIELFGEIFTAGFAGLLTFWLCEAANISPLLSAVFIGVAGHMGSRAIFMLEKTLEARFPRKVD